MLNTNKSDENVNLKNIAGRLPENSRNRFVDRQSEKTVKKTDQKNWSYLYKLLLPLLADLK